MENKIQELTEKIYNEGVTKAKDEAEVILSEAKKRAEEIVLEAKNNAASIVDLAKKNVEDLKVNTEKDIKLSTLQAISAIKQQITDLIVTKTVNPTVSESLKDNNFIKTILETVVKSLMANEDASANLEVLLPQKNQEELEKFFTAKEFSYLNAGISFEFDKSVSGGFKIGPKEGGYKISFTDADFETFFKVYLRKRTANLLFDKGE